MTLTEFSAGASLAPLGLAYALAPSREWVRSYPRLRLGLLLGACAVYAWSVLHRLVSDSGYIDYEIFAAIMAGIGVFTYGFARPSAGRNLIIMGTWIALFASSALHLAFVIDWQNWPTVHKIVAIFGAPWWWGTMLAVTIIGMLVGMLVDQASELRWQRYRTHPGLHWGEEPRRRPGGLKHWINQIESRRELRKSGLRSGPKHLVKCTFAIIEWNPKEDINSTKPYIANVFYEKLGGALQALRRLRKLTNGNVYWLVTMPTDFTVIEGQQRWSGPKYLKDAHYAIFSWSQEDSKDSGHILPKFYQYSEDAQEVVNNLRQRGDGNNYAAAIMPADFVIDDGRDRTPSASS